MHISSIRGSADRLPLLLLSHQLSTNAEAAAHAPAACGLSREELRKIVLDLLG